ncbi:pentatricopeptide repeat-containing protein At2g20710, mitochondrial-like [Argentina anserina]|uniref:pentatricopeptide repeat-containing protein At2g20710, mitochondrial-like n=1 Tax=Argentina anserina TaxID=57926 RepID=UPI0021762587|nr:pentatricopeptide repeat-containing protein At2g20710, mitochondrial-like [Potentilla anserina]
MMRHSHFISLVKNVGNPVSLYSTASTKCHRDLWQGSLNRLYDRITASSYKASVVPILDRWLQDGQTLDKHGLLTIIKELRHYKNYTRALEVVMWMNEKWSVGTSDVVIQLDLIAKVHGIEQAENYFNNTPKQLKVPAAYNALLNCYCLAKQLEKAEATIQRMRDLGFSRTSWSYNCLLNLYYKTENHEKFDSLLGEMEEKGIPFDSFTYGIRLGAAAAASDLEEIDKIMTEWESNPSVYLDWSNYAAAASGYTKAGDVDKALAMLKICEEKIPISKRQREAYEHLMTQYAVLGKKDDTLRLWKCYKEQMKIYNKGYLCIMSSLLKFDDIESVEKMFEEWESEHLTYDIRIPNILIGAYTRNGLLEKAEAIISRIILKDVKPNSKTWSILAKGYLHQGQIEKTLELATKAVIAAPPRWMPDKGMVAACLECFKRKDDLEGAEEFIKLLGDKNSIPLNVHERLLSHIKNENWTALLWEFPKGDDEETSEFMPVESKQ